MIDRLQRQFVFLAPAVVMSAWATVMLHTLVNGQIKNLLSPMFRSYVGIAAGVLFLLSVLHLLLYRPNPEAVPSPWRQMGRWLLLLLPILGAAVLSPDALSTTTANIRSSGTAGVAPMPSMSAHGQQDAEEALKTDAGAPAPMEVTDLITVAHTPALIKKFEGRQVHVIGLFASSGSPKLMRWVMWCCAADAAPASVDMTGEVGGPYKDQQWLDITGVAHFPATMGQITPSIEVTSAKKTDEPDEPFLSP